MTIEGITTLADLEFVRDTANRIEQMLDNDSLSEESRTALSNMWRANVALIQEWNERTANVWTGHGHAAS